MNRINILALPLLVAAMATTTPAAASPPESAETSAAPAAGRGLEAEGFVATGVEHGVKLYRRDRLPGLEIAAEGAIAATPERVRRVLLDYGNQRRWQPRLKESRTLARGSDFLDVYERLSLPVIDDRDFTLHVTWGAAGDVLWTRFTTLRDRGPAPVAGVVRVQSHEGSWRLQPTDGGKGTLATCRFHLDLGGSVPAGLAQSQAAKDMVEVFRNLGAEAGRAP